MDIREAKRINESISNATNELNSLIKDAASRGLKIDLDIVEYQSLQLREPTSTIISKVFINPDLL